MLNRMWREPGVWVAVLSIIAALLGFVREQAVAAKLGLSADSDAIYTAIAVVGFIPGLLSNALSQLIAPHYAASVKKDGAAAGLLTLGRLLGMGTAVASAGAVILVLGIWSGYWFFEGIHQSKLNLSFSLSTLLALAVPATVYVTGTLTALNVLGRYSLSASTNIVVPIIGVVGVVMLPASPWSVIGVWLAGYYAQAFLLHRFVKQEGVSLQIPNSLEWVKTVLGDLLHALMGSLALVLAASYIQAVAATSGATEMASFNFGTKVPNAFFGLAGTFLGVFLGPLFAQMASGLPYSKKRLKMLLGLTVLGALLISPLLYLFSEDIVRLLLKRGAFAEKDVSAVAAIQMMGALQIPAFLFSFVSARLLLAYGDISLMHKTSWLFVLIVLVTAKPFKTNFGLGGLLLSNSLAMVSVGLVMSWGCWTHFKRSRTVV